MSGPLLSPFRREDLEPGPRQYLGISHQQRIRPVFAPPRRDVPPPRNVRPATVCRRPIGERPRPLVRFGRPRFQVRLDGLLSRVYERLLDDGGLELASLHPHRQPRPQICVLDRHQGVPDVLLEARGPECRRDLPYLRALLDDLQIVLYVTYQRVAIELYADHLAAHALVRDALERLLADKVSLLVQLHRVPQVCLERVQEMVVAVAVVIQGYIGAVAEDAGLHAPDLARPDYRKVVRLAITQHRVPEPQAVAAGVPEVDLEPHLAGVAGPRHHDVHAVEIELVHPVVLEVQDLVAEDGHHEVPRLGTLDLDRHHIRLPDLHVVARRGGHAFGPEQHVAVGDRQPEVVLAKAQEHRVVDDATVHVGVERELALLDRALVEVARGEHVGELEGVGTCDLDLPLGGHVPYGDVVDELPVFDEHVVVVPGMVLAGGDP